MTKDRFRFRAWDPVKKEYYDEFYLMANGNGAIYSPVEEEGNEDRLIIEQCTGMKDDDGKLIYEGDLVDLVGYGVCKVDWVEDTAEFMFQNLGEDLREHVETMMLYKWKVVGNIHENAELLK